MQVRAHGFDHTEFVDSRGERRSRGRSASLITDDIIRQVRREGRATISHLELVDWLKSFSRMSGVEASLERRDVHRSKAHHTYPLRDLIRSRPTDRTTSEHCFPSLSAHKRAHTSARCTRCNGALAALARGH